MNTRLATALTLTLTLFANNSPGLSDRETNGRQGTVLPTESINHESLIGGEFVIVLNPASTILAAHSTPHCQYFEPVFELRSG